MTRQYGTAQRTLDYHANPSWTLHVEPHVAIRLKNIFPRAENHRAGEIRLKDSPEVCRDLRWVLDRYPLQVDPADFAYLEERSDEFDRRNQEFQSIVNGVIAPRPFELAIPARDYQRVAADLALRVKGLLIADEMGTGKTISGICALTDPTTRPALVVTLTHLPKQWDEQIEKFAPMLTTHIIKKGTPYPIGVGEKRRGSFTEDGSLIFPDILLINYSKLNGWAEMLAGLVRCVIFDEIQELRHVDSMKAIAARKIAEKCDYRIGLSGTPIYNYGEEFYNVIDVLQPGALGTRVEFLREWCIQGNSDGKAKISNPKAFGTYTREAGLMIRRTRVDIKRELPAFEKIPHYVESDADAFAQATSGVDELARFLLQREGSRFDRMRAGGDLDWRLRHATGLSKAPYVAEFVKLLCETDEKVLLFGWHHDVYAVWKEKLREYNPVLFTGQESTTQKQAAKEAFCSGDSRVLIMSLRSGAGIDGLQHYCRTLVFGELDWSPGVHAQCEMRVHRDGQVDPVVAYYLLSNEGSDPVIADVLGVKRGQLEGVISPDADIIDPVGDSDRIRHLAESFLRQTKKSTKTTRLA